MHKMRSLINNFLFNPLIIIFGLIEFSLWIMGDTCVFQDVTANWSPWNIYSKSTVGVTRQTLFIKNKIKMSMFQLKSLINQLKAFIVSFPFNIHWIYLYYMFSMIVTADLSLWNIYSKKKFYGNIYGKMPVEVIRIQGTSTERLYLELVKNMIGCSDWPDPDLTQKNGLGSDLLKLQLFVLSSKFQIF